MMKFLHFSLICLHSYVQIIRIFVLPVNNPPVLTLPQDSGGKSFFDVHEGELQLLQIIPITMILIRSTTIAIKVIKIIFF